MRHVTKVCPVCGSIKWSPFLTTSTNRIMAADQRIIPGNLEKVMCKTCGVATNAHPFSSEELEKLYGEEYTLNTLGNEEHQFFTSNGPVPRSQVFFDWILPHIPESFSSLLEIGCGEGNVLKRFQAQFPDKQIRGIDGNVRACELARAKGLDVNQRLIFDDHVVLPSSDIIILIAVLEHIEEIQQFIAVLRRAMNDRGRIIFCLPVQDYPGYDIFFAEHIWHFTTHQCMALLERNGFRVFYSDSQHPINHGFGLFVCEKTTVGENLATIPVDSESVRANRDHWQHIFGRIDLWLEKAGSRRLALFGSGEVATLFLTFTSLGQRNIIAFIDEDPMKIGITKRGIPVQGINWLENGEADTVILTINPKYHELVAKKLEPFKVKIYSYKDEE